MRRSFNIHGWAGLPESATGYALISKISTKEGFPVEHFSTDLQGQICLPSALRGLNFFLKAPLRGGEALGAIRARKKSANQQKKRVRTRVRTRFSPPPETDSATEAHPNTYFLLRRRCAALFECQRWGRKKSPGQHPNKILTTTFVDFPCV